MDVRELRKRYEGGEREFTNVDLHGADLAGIVLVGANLTGATLFGANLVGADLRNANFQGANLQQANLTGVNLIGANLTEAIFRRANLMDAVLDQAICDRAIFTGAILPNGNLYSAAADLIATMDSQALSPEEIQRDLAKIKKPQNRNTIQPRKPRRTRAEFWLDLPKFPLCLFITAYIAFGYLLADSPFGNNPLFWLVLLFTSSLWRVSFDYVWIIPAINAFIILLAYQISPLLLVLMALTFGMVWINSIFNRSSNGIRALRESLWVVSIAFSVIISLIDGQMILIAAIIFGTMGMTLPLQMDTILFPHRQITQTTSMAASVGLLIGIFF